MLTQEKADALAAFMKEDEARANKFLEMSAEDAVKTLAENGLAYTAEELADFAQALAQAEKAAEGGELDEAELEGVSGGALKSLPTITIPFLPWTPDGYKRPIGMIMIGKCW